MSRHILFILAASLFLSCTAEAPQVEDRLVVEGWICTDEPPIVLLTTSFSPGARQQDRNELEKHIIRHARVSISDGESEIMLTGMPKKGFMPPYIYTTSHILGEEGKTYTLKVDTEKYHAAASASIPSAVALTEVKAEKFGQTDTTWLIKARFRDNPDEKNYYKFFTRVKNVDSTFFAARMSLIDDGVLSPGEECEAKIVPGAGIFDSWEYRPCFYSGETVILRFCSMDEKIADIWRAFDSGALHCGIPLMTSVGNVPGNVEGALGYFAAYGSTLYTVPLPK